ncbi:TPA: hypothetical protein N0F65_006211 [Lagenidium giganteum]|uniref:Uncharacterized protein n=1 Tax=Lagenidium giganteum TaxID=4803 RepID=A0AAV2Z4M6_9STRA|nr:TPA: hypothetical protein N0F65_006211 [Lagenidium giganteum]
MTALDEDGHGHAAPARGLMDMVAEAKARLQNMEISCKELLRSSQTQLVHARGVALAGHGHGHGDSAAHAIVQQFDQLELLQVQVDALKQQMTTALLVQQEQDRIYHQAMTYATAKSTANAVLHGLFDQASAAKLSVLRTWWESGVIPTRDGLKHWKLDPTQIRNEGGASLLHVAVDVSMARQPAKVKLAQFLIDRLGFDPNIRDLVRECVWLVDSCWLMEMMMTMMTMSAVWSNALTHRGHERICRGRRSIWLKFAQLDEHSTAFVGGCRCLQVVECLLARGCDPLLADRSGLTALSLVRTLSRPPEDVVQCLATAESAALRGMKREQEKDTGEMHLARALMTCMFLKKLTKFVVPEHAAAFTAQTEKLERTLLRAKYKELVPLDECLHSTMPLLFDAAQLQHPDMLFVSSMYWDEEFRADLTIEAAAYSLSLVTAPPPAAALYGLTWAGWLLRLVQHQRAAVPMVSVSSQEPRTTSTLPPGTPGEEEDVDMEPTPASSPRTPVTRSPNALPSRNSSSTSRQAWYYAVLFKASTHPFPPTLTVKKGATTVECAEDAARLFPLEDRLLIGSSEYFAVSYDPHTRQITLDRPYEGEDATEVAAYMAGSCSSLHPPYVGVKRIWEREPGNKFEDQMSHEQELFQDYQFLDPESDYEVAVKLGPLPSKSEAKRIVDDSTSTLVLTRGVSCLSDQPCCNHHCPQKRGHSLCVDTLMTLGRDLAKRHLGRPTFSKQLKARASLQKRQNRFLGRQSWPGSPSKTPPDASGALLVASTTSHQHVTRTLDFS